jgi:RecB family exonuclease
LGAAGVPVEVASDDTPLVREPAVLPLVDALSFVAHAGADPDDPRYVGVDRAAAMLVSPLAGLDATDVRALARQLRALEKEASPESPLPSPELLRRALLEPDRLVELRGRGAQRVGRLGRLLRRAGEALDDGATVEELLWLLWAGTDWPRRLRSGVESGGTAARLAHRDLDAVCALFEVAARAEEQRGHTSVESFLATLTAQQIPADTLAERGVRGDAVRLLTAHRSKGLEWRLVVVAQVQEGAWPDLRRRGSLLQADRISADGLLPPTTRATLLAEERRLFYVACTRARQLLVVTAVRSPEDDGEQPSRFLDELGVAPVSVQGRPSRPLSLAGLVAELRRTVADPACSEPLRAAAAGRLARLVRATDRSGRALVPQADPATWWGTRAASRSTSPVRPAEQPVVVSASTLEGLLTCPARWFLQREAGGQQVSTAQQGFGSVVHAIADRIARGDLGSGADLMAHVDQVWGQMVFRTPWAQARERAQVEAALDRFVAWHNRPGARVALGTERHLSCEVTLPDGQLVRLNGYADRLELDEDGRVVVIDLKTGKHPPTKAEVLEHPQLGLYQLAVDNGAADELAGRPVVSGGAELVQLRHGDGQPKVQAQEPQLPDESGSTLVQRQLMDAVACVRAEEFVARPGKHCNHCSFHAICPSKTSGTVLA